MYPDWKGPIWVGRGGDGGEDGGGPAAGPGSACEFEGRAVVSSDRIS